MMKEEADLKSTSVALLNPDDPRAEAKARRRARNDKMVKIMRFIQSTLGAILSIIIAVFQGRVYWTYQKTQSQPGTWPAVPNTMPTILLFSVAVAALVFDICMLVAYMWPSSRYARWAVVIGGGMHTVVASTKTVSFAIAAVVSKTTFDYGNSSGTNGDLWSYTCTDQAETLNNVIQSDSNCNGQVSVYFYNSHIMTSVANG
jgi:hypothetical protein